MNNQKSFFPKNLQFLRKEKNMTQSELGNKIHVDQTTIGRWEDGNREPTVGNVANIANLFNVSIPDLLDKDLSKNNQTFDELELLFSKHKDILTNDDKEYIKFDFTDTPEIKSAKVCDIALAVIDGMGEEYANEFNLKNNYEYIIDKATGEKRKINNKN